MTPIETVLAKLPDVKQNGQGWSARCPAHDDHNPSLSIGEGDDGRALVKCHAGCTTDAVLRELDLTMADLMPPKDDHAPSRHIVATYDFTDERGELLYQVVRFDPKDFRQRRSDGNGGWAWSIEGVKRVLYRLPGIVEAGPESFVFIPEGEEDVDVTTVLEILKANAEMANSVVKEIAELLPESTECECLTAAQYAIITAPEAITNEAKERLKVLYGSYLGG